MHEHKMTAATKRWHEPMSAFYDRLHLQILDNFEQVSLQAMIDAYVKKTTEASYKQVWNVLIQAVPKTYRRHVYKFQHPKVVLKREIRVSTPGLALKQFTTQAVGKFIHAIGSIYSGAVKVVITSFLNRQDIRRHFKVLFELSMLITFAKHVPIERVPFSRYEENSQWTIAQLRLMD
jgi:succinate dehydrogenase hydrophobic anchor subunit